MPTILRFNGYRAGFSRHELNEIYNFLREHRRELLNAWHEYFE